MNNSENHCASTRASLHEGISLLGLMQGKRTKLPAITRRCNDNNNPPAAASFTEKFHHRFSPRTDLKFFIDIVTMLPNRLNVHA
ncbi:MAG: hypothetical protein JWQ71_3288 [Pedosphaera sp.]|nr:hypothetical protein [Pedosphaera sp.]